MNAIRPNRTRRSLFSAQGALSIASATMLLAVAAFSVMTTGCSDDDDGSCCSAGNDSYGLGGHTYTASANVSGTDADLVIVTRGGGSTSPASTAGMLMADLEAGPTDGLLVFNTGVRDVLTGTYDPNVTGGDPNLTASSAGGPNFEGNATTPSAFEGTMTIDGISGTTIFSGDGAQEDAPLIHLLGLWEHETDIVVDCGNLGAFDLRCEGFTRLRKVGLTLRMDVYESCEEEPFECVLSGPSLTDGVWSGLNYSETDSFNRTFNNCTTQIDGDLNLSVDSQLLSSDTIGDITFTNANCLPTNTVCDIEQKMTATRCVNCWPAECN